MKKQPYNHPKKPKSRRKDNSPDKRRWIFPVACLLLLLGSTVWWSYWGAKVQQGNADQLINAQLFESRNVLRNSSVPSTHSFLLKWPLFWLIHAFHQTAFMYVFVTILLSLSTVAGFAWLLYKLRLKPTRLGLLYLAVASCLLLVPAAPYSGGLLPVNMAMAANRNIEYLLYMGVLWIIAGLPNWKSKKFILATAALGLVVTSDRLFLYFSVISALLGLVAGRLLNKPKLLSVSKQLIVAALASAICSIALVSLLVHIHITGIETGGVSPYGMVSSFHQLSLNVFYAANGLITNFGANPVFDAQVVRAIPSLLAKRMLSPYGIAFVVNVLVFALGIRAVVLLLKSVMQAKTDRSLNQQNTFVLLMIGSSVAAFATFIGSNHYAVVDARYLTITMFTIFSALAVAGSNFRLSINRLRFLLAALLISLVMGSFGAKVLALDQQRALLSIKGRNETIGAALKQSPGYSLVGDYWRVVPIKDLNPSRTTIVPLDDCLNPSSVLSSKAWSNSFEMHPFIYLLSLDKSLTNFPHCDSAVITRKYGQPNRLLVVQGTPSNPQELLLFYDAGAHTPSNQGVVPLSAASTDDLPLTNLVCTSGKTILQIIAHQDDDLLFMNPALQTNFDQGDCVRTVYLTAGDAGQEQLYWIGREQGSKAAYNSMLKSSAQWIEKPLLLQGGSQVTVASLEDTNRASLVFFKLPDGNLEGQGFRHTKSASLSQLYRDRLPRLYSVDNFSSYSKDELVIGLAHIMELVKPDIIRTQSTESSKSVHDHSDHTTTGRFTDLAVDMYIKRLPEHSAKPVVEFYQGYPVRDQPSNVSGESLSRKLAVFNQYAKFDNATCRPTYSCWRNSNYSLYVSRQYKVER